MWFRGSLKASISLWSHNINNQSNSSLGKMASALFPRYMSRTCAVNVRKINPKVPIQEAYAISNSLYEVIKQSGPLTIGNTWAQAKEAGVSGLNSKTHMKLMLKWMRGRKMLKLLCNHVGSNKKFMHCTLPEDPEIALSAGPKPKPQIKKKTSNKRKKLMIKRKKQAK